MNVVDVLCKDAILIDLKARDKKGIIEELALPAAQIAGLEHRELVRVLLDRERLGSTGIGGGVAIPHGKLASLEKLVLGFGLSRSGIDFDSIDNRPSHIFFLLITPEKSTGLHLKLLARISRILKIDDVKDKLLEVTNREDVLDVIHQVDQES